MLVISSINSFFGFTVCLKTVKEVIPPSGLVKPTVPQTNKISVQTPLPEAADPAHLFDDVSRLTRMAQWPQDETSIIKTKTSRFARAIKRGFDIILSLFMIAGLFPLFLVLFLIIRRDGGDAFFRQTRVGKNRKLFTCYKFRSMHVDAEKVLKDYLSVHPEAAREWATFQKLKNDIRITNFGSFIRRTSLDELPQLLNVLKGDMSFVGPRPCTPEQANLYASDFAVYQSVRPGITGPWQVGGRNRLSFAERVKLETDYVMNWSLQRDIHILWRTIPTVLLKGQAF